MTEVNKKMSEVEGHKAVPCECSWRLMEDHGEYRVEAAEMRRYEE
jgi:hypothetical protein